MRCSSCSCSPAMLTQVLLFFTAFLEITSSIESNDVLSTSRADNQPSSRHRRAPGWGKRRSLNDALYEDPETAQELLASVAALKRAPGWGKRFSAASTDKVGPGEKRAPGWGKRSDEIDIDDEDLVDKRAPGWGKRAPGWGKRAPGWGKRAPGWGKRAPGWGKRAPGWGKRSGGDDYCQALDEMVDSFIYKAVEADFRRHTHCGNVEESNEPFRK